MRLAQCMELKKGDAVQFKDGYGWWRDGTFIGIVDVVKMGRMYASDLFDKSFNWKSEMEKGHKCKEVAIGYIDDNGRRQTAYVNPRLVVRGM